MDYTALILVPMRAALKMMQGQKEHDPFGQHTLRQRCALMTLMADELACAQTGADLNRALTLLASASDTYRAEKWWCVRLHFTAYSLCSFLR